MDWRRSRHRFCGLEVDAVEGFVESGVSESL